MELFYNAGLKPRQLHYGTGGRKDGELLASVSSIDINGCRRNALLSEPYQPCLEFDG
jgi:hypothetical protein